MSAEQPSNEKQSRRRQRREAEEKQQAAQVQAADEETEEERDEGEDESDSRGITAKKGRPTPGRRNRAIETAQEEGGGNIFTRTLFRIRTYIADTRSEILKVSWPTRDEVISLTRIVLIVTIIASLALGAISLAFTELVRIGLDLPLVFVGFFIIVAAALVVFLVNQNRRSGGSE
ncbi:MAG: preprotein translocase subunit SecE [Chloroflexi bacterium]|nr:preprotein translocase subunit SecE [Chloroflexota bacterium]